MSTLKKEILIILTIAICSCTSVKYLQDGHTLVPRDSKFYDKSKNFDKSFINLVDTSVVYKEILSLRKDYLTPLRSALTNKYGIYRFYGNGCFNLFYSDINDTTFDIQDFNPNYAGSRGKLYLKDDNLKGLLFTQSELDSNEVSDYKCSFYFNGDTIFVDIDNNYKRTYLKEKISPSLLTNKADW